METADKPLITVKTIVNAPIHTVWACWTSPDHITQWNQASADWHTPRANNDLRVGGKFVYRMEAIDGSMGFDFEGIYEEVIPHQRIAYTIADGRKVTITFEEQENHTLIAETFEAETHHSIEMQQMGWQAILDNFKKHVESATTS